MKTFKLSEVARIYSGGTPSTKISSYYENGNIAWITPKDLSGYRHKYISSGQRNITEEGYRKSAAILLPKGSVLFSSRAPIGYVAIAENELCTNQGFKSFVCDEKYITSDYLYYFLLCNKEKIAAKANGSTFKEISLKAISDFEIELPTIEQQKEIVAKVTMLDEKYDFNCKLLKQLYEIIDCVYCNCFEEAEYTYAEVELGDIVDIVTGGTPSTKNEQYWTNGIYEWFTPSDITSLDNIYIGRTSKKISVTGLANSGAKLIPANSVIMTSRATIAEVGINEKEVTTNQGILSLIPNTDYISSIQLYFWIKHNADMIKSIANGSTFKELYKKDLGKLRIVLSQEKRELFETKIQHTLNYYRSIVAENEIIKDLRLKLLENMFG